MGCLFTFSMVSFEAQRFLILILKAAAEKTDYLHRRERLAMVSQCTKAGKGRRTDPQHARRAPPQPEEPRRSWESLGSF